MRLTFALVDGERLGQQRDRGVGSRCGVGKPAGPVEQRGPLQRRLAQVRGPLQVALGFAGCSQGRRAVARTNKRLTRLVLDLGCIGRVRRRLVRRQVMGGDHLDELVLLGVRGLEVRGRGEMPRAPFPLRERLVRDVTDELLEEAVLPVFRRARVGLHAQHLLAHERRQQRFELRLGEVRQRGEAGAGERLPEHSAVLQQPPLLSGEAVQSSGDQGMKRLGDLKRLDLADRPVRGSLEHEQAAVEQHAHRLDRVQGYALGASEDLPADGLGEPGNEPGEQILHRGLRERLQIEGREVPVTRAPGRAPLEQVRAGQGDHVQRRVPRPLEEVLDEVEQALVRPLHVLEGEDGRVDVGETLEEKPPGREQVLLVAQLVLREPEQLRQAGLDEAPLVGHGDVLLEGRPELLQRGRGLLVLCDPAAHPHHVRQRPVRHAFAVRKAAAAVPVGELRQAVEVLVELPREAGLPDPGDAGDGDQVRLSLLRRDVEQLLDLTELAIAADERSLEAFGLERAAGAGDHPQRVPQRGQALLALQLEAACILVDDRALGRTSGRFSDQDRARVGDGLDPRRGVDEVAGNHALPLGPERDRRFAGEDAGAGA